MFAQELKGSLSLSRFTRIVADRPRLRSRWSPWHDVPYCKQQQPGSNVSLLAWHEAASSAIVRIKIYRLYINAITVLVHERPQEARGRCKILAVVPQLLGSLPDTASIPGILHVVGAFFVNIRELFTRRGSQRWREKEKRERGYFGPLPLASIRRLLPVNRKYTILPINLRIRALPIPIRRFVPSTSSSLCVIEWPMVDSLTL